MNYIVNRIDLDVHDAGAQAWINVRQNETNRKICIALTESGEPFALTEDCDAVFAGTKPDATVFFNSCEITGNTIEYVLTGQNLAQTGDLKCEIRLYGSGNTLICSPRFVVHVQENAVDDNGIESADEFSELTELISEAREATDAANASVITGATASVDSNVGTPEVELTLTQEENGQSMYFEFHNLKGETGDPGVHVGDTAPTNPAISLWIDTDDNGASQVLSVMGTFASLAALQAAVTNPNNGDSYGVGAAAPYDIYRYDAASGEWINYGNYKGDIGPAGPQGPAGADGLSPTATVTKSGSVATITITDKNGTTTVTVSDGEVPQEQLDTKATAITETASGAIANFPDGADDIPVAALVVNIEPKQSGSGDPSPSNVRTISGWTGCDVTRTGKNLFDKSTASDNTTWTTSGTQGYSAGKTSSALIPVKPSESYYVGFNGMANVYGVYEFDINQNYIGRTFAGALTPRAITLPNNCYYVGLVINSTYVDTAFFSYPSTATTYEPYQANSISVDWTTEAETVYGGTIDVATGLLTVTHQLVQLPATATWTINNNAGYASLSSLGVTPPMKNPPVGTPSRTLTRTNWCKTNALIPTSTGWSATASSNDPQFVVSYDDYLMLNIGVTHPTSAQINQFITDVGLQLYYPLATAQTYQLTPQQLNTLLGTNNIFADCGSTEVEYRADTKLYIEKLTMPTEDDLVANQAITSGQYFMIGNSLYLALANIANGAQITIGTNAQRVSLADALNTINS